MKVEKTKPYYNNSMVVKATQQVDITIDSVTILFLSILLADSEIRIQNRGLN